MVLQQAVGAVLSDWRVSIFLGKAHAYRFQFSVEKIKNTNQLLGLLHLKADLHCVQDDMKTRF
jgi:hypothetical protein